MNILLKRMMRKIFLILLWASLSSMFVSLASRTGFWSVFNNPKSHAPLILFYLKHYHALAFIIVIVLILIKSGPSIVVKIATSKFLDPNFGWTKVYSSFKSSIIPLRVKGYRASSTGRRTDTHKYVHWTLKAGFGCRLGLLYMLIHQFNKETMKARLHDSW